MWFSKCVVLENIHTPPPHGRDLPYDPPPLWISKIGPQNLSPPPPLWNFQSFLTPPRNFAISNWSEQRSSFLHYDAKFCESHVFSVEYRFLLLLKIGFVTLDPPCDSDKLCILRQGFVWETYVSDMKIVHKICSERFKMFFEHNSNI